MLSTANIRIKSGCASAPGGKVCGACRCPLCGGGGDCLFASHFGRHLMSCTISLLAGGETKESRFPVVFHLERGRAAIKRAHGGRNSVRSRTAIKKAGGVGSANFVASFVMEDVANIHLSPDAARGRGVFFAWRGQNKRRGRHRCAVPALPRRVSLWCQTKGESCGGVILSRWLPSRCRSGEGLPQSCPFALGAACCGRAYMPRAVFG